MNTFLFAWNPEKWNWTHLEQSIEELEQTGRVKEMWSCASHKSIKVGDRAFLIKLGKKPTGIIAAGFVAAEPFLAKHWSGVFPMYFSNKFTLCAQKSSPNAKPNMLYAF